MAENGKPWGCRWKQRLKSERGKWTQVEQTFATADEMDQCLKKVMEDESITFVLISAWGPQEEL